MKQNISIPATGTHRWSFQFFIPLACMALCLLIVVPWIAHAAGGGGGFNGVVSSIENRYNVRATRIPFMELASLIAGTATHWGVGGVQIAEFEHFSGPVDGDELTRMIEEKLGQGWERMIRETSRKGNEQTLIFAHPEGRRMGLFVLDLDGHELDVVQVSVDPDHLTETVSKYEHHDPDRDGDASD